VDYASFITTVREIGHIPEDEAERAACATLQTLAERISAGEAGDLAERLPAELRSCVPEGLADGGTSRRPETPGGARTLRRMPAYEYTTDVLTHGFLGRKDEELDRNEFEERLNRFGAEGWEFEKLLTHMNLHGEKDGHVLIFKRERG
jgi:hypothetical protein